MIPRSESFPRAEHLRDTREFRILREQGRRLVGRFVILNALDRAPTPRRFGVITARSFGPAVARNHARRWLREIYRRNKTNIKPTISLVVVARQPLAKATFQDVQAELLQLFQRADALTLS